MVVRIARFLSGVSALRSNNREYFLGNGHGAVSPFRQDVRAFMGGFLAVAFIAAGLSNLAHAATFSTNIVTVVAGIAGGVVGKYWLVS